MFRILRFLCSVFLLSAPSMVFAQNCFQSSIMAPAPFLGNHDEIFKLADGSFWQVQYEYSYLYEYYPEVIVCPGSGKLSINGKTLSIKQVGAAAGGSAAATRIQGVTIVAAVAGCRGWLIGDGRSGYYLLEWYGGYDPSVGDVIAGELSGYGFKDVLYSNGRSGRLYVDDYMLSKDRVIEKYREKCR